MTVAELYEVRELRAELDKELDRQRSLEAAIDGLTMTFDRLPGSKSQSSRTEKLAILLVETGSVIKDLSEKLVKVAVDLTDKIIRADLSSIERDILIMRYVRGLSFTEIVRRTSLSRSHIFRLHADSLKKISH